MKCMHCGERELKHQDEHEYLCCDCADLSCGMPLERLNAERAAKNKAPVVAWRCHHFDLHGVTTPGFGGECSLCGDDLSHQDFKDACMDWDRWRNQP